MPLRLPALSHQCRRRAAYEGRSLISMLSAWIDTARQPSDGGNRLDHKGSLSLRPPGRDGVLSSSSVAVQSCHIRWLGRARNMGGAIHGSTAYTAPSSLLKQWLDNSNSTKHCSTEARPRSTMQWPASWLQRALPLLTPRCPEVLAEQTLQGL